MTIRFRFRQPAPVARKACKHCENRRALFRQEGIRKWEPYYALCYKCYQHYVTRAEAALATPAAAATAADRPGRTLALETGLMPAR
jgi:hypothetical protein